MKIGITGSRTGLTAKQFATLDKLLSKMLRKYDVTECHHGDCFGVDFTFNQYIYANSKATIVVHPPTIDKQRAFCAKDEDERFVVEKCKPYLDRNKDIVNSSDIMIGCPDTPIEKSRSGTWSTIRYARKQQTILFVVLPDGTIKRDKT